ncbi:MAG: hypothetical protein GY780_10670 [bacterium]|nr:hypothetical protein [bacterium]
MGKQLMKLTFVLMVGLLLWPTLACESEKAAALNPEVIELAETIKLLDLGAGQYTVGNYLTSEQVKHAEANSIDDTYPGTIKFSDEDFFVVAAKNSHLILAIYQSNEEASADDTKNMVGHLMNRFGIPTTMAHGKLIYWAFSKDGLIDEESYGDSKLTGDIEILATVKLNSSIVVSPGMSNETNTEVGSLYYIITSDRLLEKFIGDEK